MARFQPRIRKQAARRRAEAEGATAKGQPLAQEQPPSDSNRLEILPEAQTAERADRVQIIARGRTEPPKSSRKKQKRLDKYIENKLKKEESLKLLKKLAANKVDTSLLRSSRSLGAGSGTKHDAIIQHLKEEQAGLHLGNEQAGSRRANMLLEIRSVEEPDVPSSTSESDGSEWSGFHSDENDDAADSRHATPFANENVTQAKGSGLKRPLDFDEEGKPIIQKRQRVNSPEQPIRTAATRLENFADSDGSTSGEGEMLEEDESEEEDSEPSWESSSEADAITDEKNEMLTSVLFAVRNKEVSDAAEQVKARKAAAKAMMDEWQNEAQGLRPEPSNIEALLGISDHIQPPKPRAPEEDALPESLKIMNPASRRQAHYITIDRPLAIQESRAKLSIIAEEQNIMEAIHNHSVVIVCGATGSGKTTQVPQFLYESGYGSSTGPTPGMIGITQPRRVAAVVMAKRVGEELGRDSRKVAYQIRFDSTVGSQTAIKFMTDGVLLRELATDFLLPKYSAIIIDEAHERSVNTDILIGMLSRTVDLRLDIHAKDPAVKPLKLVIMSATLRTEDFALNKRLFRKELPPMVEAEGRQYKVVEHFARRTERDYVQQAFRKITKGHRRLPPGTMLVFLTGQNEINNLSKLLSRSFGSRRDYVDGAKVRVTGKDLPMELDDFELGEDRVDDYGDVLEEDEDETGEADHEGFDLDVDEPRSQEVLVLPLYSQLPTAEQQRVFEPPPANTRLIILATNVAETSITIPGVRYVFDCGRVKEKKYNSATGVFSFEIGWVSKASATQRLGRAGRTGPGHCYRLYSSAIYESFEDNTAPEIVSAPLEGVVLQLKSMDLQHVINFPFPTPPERAKIVKAERLLQYLGALDVKSKITSMGHTLMLYPISPRYAKMLAIGHQRNCIYLTTALVAALATPELFVPEAALDLRDPASHTLEGAPPHQVAHMAAEARTERRRAYNAAHSDFAASDITADALKQMSALCAYLWRKQETTGETVATFCERNFLQPKRLEEAAQLYRQLISIILLHHPSLDDAAQRCGAIDIPTASQTVALKQFVAAGFLDQVAIRADAMPTSLKLSVPRSNRATDVPYITLSPSHDALPSASAASDPAVYIHPSSVLARGSAASLPQFIIYASLQQGVARAVAADGTPNPGRTRMHPLVPVTPKALRDLARNTPLLELGKPIGKIETLSPVPSLSGRWLDRRAVWVVPSLLGQARDHGGARREWPLPAVKMVQVRAAGGDWVEAAAEQVK